MTGSAYVFTASAYTDARTPHRCGTGWMFHLCGCGTGWMFHLCDVHGCSNSECKTSCPAASPDPRCPKHSVSVDRDTLQYLIDFAQDALNEGHGDEKLGLAVHHGGWALHVAAGGTDDE